MMERASPIEARNLASLEVDGRRYEGWKSVRIKHSIEQLAGTFSLEVAERGPDQSEAFAIAPGAACTVKLGADVVITGYVDMVDVNSDTSQHTIGIEGRDRTGDLVDCSAPAKEWTGVRFEEVALQLAAPYGISVTSQLLQGAGGYKTPALGKVAASKQKAGKGGTVLPRKAANSGETVHRLLEKLAKMQGVLLVSDRAGGLLITRAGLGGRATDVLALGQNLKAIAFRRGFQQLYSEIVVKGQAHGAIGTTGTTLASLQPQDTVKSKGEVRRGPAPAPVARSGNSVLRYRPLVIVAEEQADAARCQARARWEAGTREAKAKTLTLTVQGWRQSDGQLWAINMLARVKCPFVREDEDLLIAAVEFMLDPQGGTTTVLTLQSPQAFDLLPEIPLPAKGATSAAAARRTLRDFIPPSEKKGR